MEGEKVSESKVVLAQGNESGRRQFRGQYTWRFRHTDLPDTAAAVAAMRHAGRTLSRFIDAWIFISVFIGDFA